MTAPDRPGTVPESPAQGRSGEPLAVTVDRLRDELEGLRLAMRSRAAIEQAKGILMERHGCTPDEAFQRLATLSQHANVKLADVAAALVDAGQSVPGGAAAGPLPASGATPADVARAAHQQALSRWPRQVSGEGEFGSRLRLRARRTQVRSGLLAAEGVQDVLATIVRTALADHPPAAAALVEVDPAGTVLLRAWHGIPAAIAVRWQRFPLDLPLPVCEVARAGVARWLAGGRDAPALGLGLPERWRLAALLPLADPAGDGPGAGSPHRTAGIGRVPGVLVLVWSGGQAPRTDDRGAVESLAPAVAMTVRRLAGAAGAEPAEGADEPAAVEPAVALLDVMFDPVLLCEPIHNPDGSLIDLAVVHANPAAVDPAGRTAEQLSGRTLLELFPDSSRSGLFDACRTVQDTGVQVDLPAHPWRSTVQGRRQEFEADTRITRYGVGVMITWAAHRPAGGDGEKGSGS